MPDKKSNVRKAPRRKPLYALSASSDLPPPVYAFYYHENHIFRDKVRSLSQKLDRYLQGVLLHQSQCAIHSI